LGIFPTLLGHAGHKEFGQIEHLLRLYFGTLCTCRTHPTVAQLPHATTFEPLIPLGAELNIGNRRLSLLCARSVALGKLLVDVTNADRLMTRSRKWEEREKEKYNQ